MNATSMATFYYNFARISFCSSFFIAILAIPSDFEQREPQLALKQTNKQNLEELWWL